MGGAMDPRRPIDDLDRVGVEIANLQRQIDDLASPGGTRYAGTVAHAASLKTYASAGANINVNPVPNDNTVRYVQVAGASIVIPSVPTGELVITASLGECEIRPDGGLMVGYITYQVKDANNVTVAAPFGTNNGRISFPTRIGVSITTGECYHPVDTVAHPGPYTVYLFVGHWASSAGGLAGIVDFRDPALVVKVIGEGRSL